MIHPNRTRLLELKKKKKSIASSLNILKNRRQALMLELLRSWPAFLRTREEIAIDRQNALRELRQSLAVEGEWAVQSHAAANRRDIEITVADRQVLGIWYRETTAIEQIRRTVEERSYDHTATSAHLEETFHLFEEIAEKCLLLAGAEDKVKKIGETISELARKIRILEQRILPGLDSSIRQVTFHIDEREREDHYRAKRFKQIRR